MNTYLYGRMLSRQCFFSSVKKRDQCPTHKKAVELLESVIAMTKMEYLATVACERELTSLKKDELHWRGVLADSLIVDSSYYRFVQPRGNVNIKLDWINVGDYNFTVRFFTIGSLVSIVLPKEEHNDNGRYSRGVCDAWRKVDGIVVDHMQNSVVVQVASLASNFLVSTLARKEQRQICLVKKSSATNVEVILHYLNSLKYQSLELNPFLVDALHSDSRVPVPDAVSPRNAVHVFSGDLDEDKLGAVARVAENKSLHIIHGPPGTGKTTALAAVILSEVANGKRVLALAPSHAAVDALALALSKQWSNKHFGPIYGRMLRLGNPIKLTNKALQRFVPRVHCDKAESLQLELSNLREEMLMEHKCRGVLFQKEEQLLNRLISCLNDLEQKEMQQASIVLCTTSLACLKYGSLMSSFDLACIDEAAFATKPVTLPILLTARKLVLCGDHMQLPPVVRSEQAKGMGLSKSYMEHLTGIYPELVTLLGTQYRSNSLISGWSSFYFYQGRVKTHADVASIGLCQLPGVQPCLETLANVLFIDTKGCNYLESSLGSDSADDTSKANFDEVFLVECLVQKYLSYGLKPASIGVISPYTGQVALLRSVLWDMPQNLRDIDIQTVDSFQGKEKDLVIISFVRSNHQKKVGFLFDTRRLNVAVTRARRCLVCIGDTATLSNDPGLRSFITYCKTNNLIHPSHRFY